MKVLTLQGSPRKKGSTAKVLNWVEDELRDMGHEVESVFLNTKNIKGCLACAKCKTVMDDVGCIQKDDAPEILNKMIESQLVIFASPLYFWGLSAQMKTIVDRTYSLYTGYHQPDHASLVAGQKQALLVTGAGQFENNAEPVFTAFSRLQKPHMAIPAGELYVAGCKNPDTLDDTTRQQAINFAREIANE